MDKRDGDKNVRLYRENTKMQCLLPMFLLKDRQFIRIIRHEICIHMDNRAKSIVAFILFFLWFVTD